MLVLSRRQDETVRIGDNIVVSIGRIKGGSVSLAIDAPRNVIVDRGEVWQRKQMETRQPLGLESRAPEN